MEDHKHIVIQARMAALLSLRDILRNDSKPKDSLSIYAGARDQRDRAFIMELVYGVMRYRDYLDWLLQHFLKETGNLKDDTINNLRMALYQMIFMRVPDRAAVHEAVEIEKLNRGIPKLVNGVLRNYLRNAESLSASEITDPLKRLAIETSHPLWIIQRWVERFGYEEAGELARANNEMPPTVLRFRGERDTLSSLRIFHSTGIECRTSEYIPNCLVLKRSHTYQSLKDMLPIDFYVQDEASQMVSLLLSPEPDLKVLDACAAPGGKTAHMADLMQHRGQIYALEVNERRFAILEETIRIHKLSSVRAIHGSVMDLRRLINAPSRYFDRIMLDAPCSCIGVIRRNPDIKYRHKPKDLPLFRDKQLEMLQILSGYLRPRGIIAYSVCSTEKEEGEDVIRGFLQKNADFSNIESHLSMFKPFQYRDKDGLVYYRTFPHIHNIDGFFAALLRKD